MKRNKGYTPLLRAAGPNKADVVTVFARGGRRRPMNRIRCGSRARLLVGLLAMMSMAADSIHGQELQKAARKGNIKKVQKLINAGQNVNEPNRWGTTPLHAAAFWGQADIASLLLAKGAQVDAKRESGQGDMMTPLHLAALGGHRSVITLLLGHGAAVDAENNRGLTPLLLLLQHQGPTDEESIRLFLEHGANPRKADRFQNSPLHWAATGQSSNIVTRLLDAGASPSEQNRQGLTALDIAVASGNDKVAKILEDHGAVAQNYHTKSTAPAEFTLRSYNGEGNVLGKASGKLSFEQPPGRQKVGLTLNWEGGTTLGLTQRAVVGLATVFFVEPGHKYLIDVNAAGQQHEVHAIVYDAINGKAVARME